MAALVRFPAPPRVRRRASSPRAARWLLAGAPADRLPSRVSRSLPLTPRAGRAGATPVERPSSRVSAEQRPRRVPLRWAPRAGWGSPRWSSATAAWTARTSERRSSHTKRSWTRPTNSSRSSSRTGSRSLARSRVSVWGSARGVGAAALGSGLPARCRLSSPSRGFE